MIAEVCQRVVDGLGMPAELALNIVVLIFKGKDDIRNCSYYRAMILLMYGIKVVEMVFKKASWNSDYQ